MYPFGMTVLHAVGAPNPFAIGIQKPFPLTVVLARISVSTFLK